MIEKLAKVREVLAEKKAVGIERLELLKTETKRAFDEAIDRLYSRERIMQELSRRRAGLGSWRVGFFRMIFPIHLKMVLSIPFIYAMILPAVFLHGCLEVYHQICFRLYGIPRVRPGDYFVFDRQMLPYLNWFEKLNCVYCSYFNNLLQYAVEIAGRTERYWCPIKHAKRMEATHSQYGKFVEYLDAEAYRQIPWPRRSEDFSDIENCGSEGCDFTK